MSAAKDTCGKCRFFFSPLADPVGQCRIRSLFEFPRRAENEWCGEFKKQDCPECGASAASGIHDMGCKTDPNHVRRMYGGGDNGYECGDCAWRFECDPTDQEFYRGEDVAFRKHECAKHPRDYEEA